MNDRSVSMNTIQVPIQVAVESYVSQKFFLLKSCTLINFCCIVKFLFFADLEQFEHTKFSPNNKNMKRRKKFVQRSHYYDEDLARCTDV